MGWGISINQDENGFVYCEDANFETGEYDYKEYPPSSYNYIYEMVENEHSTIDYARDEFGADAACEACQEAFTGAKYSYDDLTEKEQIDMHDEWFKNTRDDIAKCVFDEDKEKALCHEIDEWNTKNREEMENLKRKYDELHSAISTLEKSLEQVRKPKKRKATLENLIAQEMEFFDHPDPSTPSDAGETESH
jgi:predicted  nucleic acid-binding Zn-ribbon protein